MSTATTKANPHLDDSKDDTRRELSERTAALKDDLRTVKSDAAAVAESAGHCVRSELNAVANRASEAVQSGRERAMKYHAAFEKRVSKNPTAAVLASVGVGLLLGRFILGRW